MSAIEKLEETWTLSSITTLFRIGSLATTSKFPAAGLSWYLQLVVRKPSNLKKGRQLFFNSRNCPSTWHGTPISVTVSLPLHLGGDAPHIGSATGVLSDELVICSNPPLLQGLLSLKVTFTNPLTCNLFNVLANVVPLAVLDASVAVRSTQEPRGPQASSALRALEQSLKTGTSFDIVFQAYTRRSSLGSVTRPIPIYANTAVLQTTTLLPDFKAEEELNFSSLFELFEGDTLPFTSIEGCEYESDSDLGNDDDNHSSNHDSLAVVQPAEELATTSSDEASASHDVRSHTPESHEDTTNTGSLSSFSQASIEAGFKEQPDIQSLSFVDIDTVPIAIREMLKQPSRVILIKGVAWKTWYAFIYYCYTGTVDFANLRSQSTSDERSCSEDGPPRCSPKSMYQLARKLDNEPLSQLALKSIETRLSADNILDEAFSKFTSRHGAIKEMEIALLLQHRSAPAVLQGLPAKIQAMAMGNLPHAASALTALYQQITQILPDQNRS